MNNPAWLSKPKKFVESINGGIMNTGGDKYFLLSMNSGDETNNYMVSLGHAKRIMQWMIYHIAEYETKFGVINVDDWKAAEVSPFSAEFFGEKGPGDILPTIKKPKL